MRAYRFLFRLYLVVQVIWFVALGLGGDWHPGGSVEQVMAEDVPAITPEQFRAQAPIPLSALYDENGRLRHFPAPERPAPTLGQWARAIGRNAQLYLEPPLALFALFAALTWAFSALRP